MDEDEWLETPAADAITNFLALVLGMTASAMGGEIGGIITKLGTSFFMYMAEKESKERPRNKLAEKLWIHLNPEREDSQRYGMILIAVWSAFESSFDDFSRALIVERPGVLKDKDISKIKVPIAELFAEQEERTDVVLTAIKEAAGKAAGVKRCEEILKYLDLNGSVPKEISSAVYHSQMVRHVWAHRAGKADSQFIEKTIQLGFNEGDLVAIDSGQLTDFMNAILMYGVILMNRHRDRHGLSPKTDFFKPREGHDNTLSEAFHRHYVT